MRSLVLLFLLFVVSVCSAQEADEAKGDLNALLYFSYEHTPMEYLMALKKLPMGGEKCNVAIAAPKDWVKKDDLVSLMRMIRVKDSTRCVVGQRNASLPSGKYSSVGKEAQNLIECFRKNVAYPNVPASFGAPDPAACDELDKWWEEYKGKLLRR